jgi:hypothetical protein
VWYVKKNYVFTTEFKKRKKRTIFILSSVSLNRRRRRRQPFNDTTFSGSEAEDSPVRGQQHRPLPPPPSDAFKRTAENAANGGLPGISALNNESRPGGGGGFSRRNLFTADDPQMGVVDSELTAGWSRIDSAAVRTTMKSSRRTVEERIGEPVRQQMTDGVPVRQQLYVEKRLELRREEEEVVTSLRNRRGIPEGESEVPLLKTPEQKNRDLDWRWGHACFTYKG